MARPKEPSDRRIVCRNRKAWHEYFIEERIEAGMVLKGTEVKSLRDGQADLKDAFAIIDRGEIFLVHMHINPWPQATYFNHEPERKRKLLLHARQIRRMGIFIEQRGFTLIPLSVYFNKGNRVKVELGLGKGKRLYDKRASIRDRDEQRNLEREGAKH